MIRRISFFLKFFPDWVVGSVLTREPEGTQLFEKSIVRANCRVLTPLVTTNFKPYGVFSVDFDKPSFLMAA